VPAEGALPEQAGNRRGRERRQPDGGIVERILCSSVILFPAKTFRKRLLQQTRSSIKIDRFANHSNL
jgi:hypothetical protein